MNRQEFIKLIWPKCVQVAHGTGIYPQIMLAQAIIESRETGDFFIKTKALTRDFHNLFGITANKNYTGQKGLVQTWEAVKISTYGEEKFLGEGKNAKGATIYKYMRYFRKYNSIEDCLKDYISVVSKPRYVEAGVFKAKNYVEQAEALKRGGYATGTNYAQLIQSIVKSNEKLLNSIVKTVEDNPGKTGGIIATILIAVIAAAIKNS